MTARITGPLKTWYDLHEALRHEVTVLAEEAASLEPSTLPAFAERFGLFLNELRTHSEVEDGLMFPAIRARGGGVPAALGDDHHREQQQVYDLSCALLQAGPLGDASALHGIAAAASALRDGLAAHLDAEEQLVLPLVQQLFDDAAQAGLLNLIMQAIPADPHLQPWVAQALSDDHLEARLRNMATSLSHAGLVGVLTQIHDGVTPEVWAVVRTRMPDLAALVETKR
jgi:iron-sulfur cluster repair protein YtfE (RIC family)